MRRLVPVLVLLGLMTLGGLGYAVIERWSWLDSAYMTVITVSTVGYCEPQALSPAGKVFTSVLILLCLFVMAYWHAALTGYIVEQDMTGAWARRRMIRMISNLRDHIIVCGTEPMAEVLIERLLRSRMAVVVVDTDKEKIELLQQRFRKLHVVVGDPTNEMTLAEANVLEAKTVVAASASEVDNLLIGITCKDIGHDITVVARSNDPHLGNRMRKAGIDEVINPAQLCGDYVASLVVPTRQPCSAQT